MNRREFLRAAAGAALAAPMIGLGRVRVRAAPQTSFPTRVVDLVRDSLVVDMLHQIEYRFDQQDILRRWLTDPTAFGDNDFEQYRRSGITVISLGRGAGPYENALRYVGEFNGFVAAHPEYFVRVDDRSDFARAKRDGKLGILISFQDSSHFRTVDDVDVFFGLGQRVSQLTYNGANRLGSGAFEPPTAGLTEFGAQVVERMNRVGMAVDLGHGGDQTMLDAFRLTRKPAIVSHGNCRALHPGYPRCVTDEAIRALAATGGVIGINFISFMVKAKAPTTVDDVVDHIDHVRDLVGIEHVGIGSDFGLESNDHVADRDALHRFLESADARYRVHPREAVEDLDHPLRFFTLTEALLRRGYTPEHIKLVLGDNFRRVLSAIWGV
jgi:membrane dipeptidase